MMKKLELICPAGTPSALKVAVAAGADCVYCGFNNETNARNFPGLNFSKEELRESIAYATEHNVKVLVAINTFPKAGRVHEWIKAVDDAVECGAYALILADIGLLQYTYEHHKNTVRRHLSVQATASSCDAIEYITKNYGVSRVVLPRVLSIRDIKAIYNKLKVEIEVFAYGGLCVMAEGKCSLSSYITGKSPNKNGVCSPAEFVKYEEKGNKLVSKLNDSVINVFNKEESPGYPTICKGRFNAEGTSSYLFEEPTSLNILNMLPDLIDAGVVALKIEGRQRGKAYVEKIVKYFRENIDASLNNTSTSTDTILGLSEGNATTTGAYVRKWL